MILAFSLLLGAQRVDAKPYALSKSYETDKKLGVGLMLGVPSAVTLKFMATDQIALDLGMGMNIAYRDRTGFHGHADFLFHPFVAVEGNSFLAPFYFGLGARLLAADGTRIGLRVPVGISFDFTNKPFEVFLEGAFVIDVSRPVEDAGTALDVNAVVGARYFLF